MPDCIERFIALTVSNAPFAKAAVAYALVLRGKQRNR